MATVWTFGDSMTERYNGKDLWSKQYIDWKGYQPKVYGDFVSEMLGYDLKNLGKAGCDNYTIFETFCKSYRDIKDGDVIIIGWTSIGRFRMVNKYGEWNTLNPHFSNQMQFFEYLSKNTIDEIFLNRDNIKYLEEVNHWIDYINITCLNKKVVHWDTIKGQGELNTYHFFEMERIKDETNNLINDLHFSENGHQQMSLKLLEIIMNKNGITNTHKLI